VWGILAAPQETPPAGIFFTMSGERHNALWGRGSRTHRR
jgi:hypothetical protein